MTLVGFLLLEMLVWEHLLMGCVCSLLFETSSFAKGHNKVSLALKHKGCLTPSYDGNDVFIYLFMLIVSSKTPMLVTLDPQKTLSQADDEGLKQINVKN